MTVLFGSLRIGELFEFRGRRYMKVAMSMAHDEERCGNVLREETEVVSHGMSPQAHLMPASGRSRGRVGNPRCGRLQAGATQGWSNDNGSGVRERFRAA